jgi:hypothetical protein
MLLGQFAQVKESLCRRNDECGTMNDELRASLQFIIHRSYFIVSYIAARMGGDRKSSNRVSIVRGRWSGNILWSERAQTT